MYQLKCKNQNCESRKSLFPGWNVFNVILYSTNYLHLKCFYCNTVQSVFLDGTSQTPDQLEMNRLLKEKNYANF